MSRPRVDFPLSPGVRFPVSRPSVRPGISRDYETTLEDLKRWLEVDSFAVAADAVLSVNGLNGHVTLSAGTGIIITPSGQTLIISSSAAGTESARLWKWDDFGAATGTSHVLSNTPADVSQIDVYLGGFRLRRVASGPGVAEFSVSGSTITLGLSKTSTTTLVVVYTYAASAGSEWQYDDLTGAASSSFTLSKTPLTPSEVDVWLTGIRLQYTAGAPGVAEFSLSGKTGTLGFTRGASDALVARYEAVAGQTFQFDNLTGAASSSFTLSATPEDPNKIDLFLTGVRLHYVASGPSPSEFTISGTSGTLGLTRAASDPLTARYVVAP